MCPLLTRRRAFLRLADHGCTTPVKALGGQHDGVGMASKARPVVLLVDDDQDLLDVLQEYLETAMPGVEFLAATGASAAWSILTERKVRVLISDYRMPGATGIDLLEKAAATWPTMALIIMSGSPDLDMATRAVNRSHVVHILQKPLEPNQLRDILASILGTKAAPQR